MARLYRNTKVSVRRVDMVNVECSQWPDDCHRVEERKQTYLPAQVRTPGGRCLGVVLDISRSGGKLQLNRPVEVGGDIVVRLAAAVERVGTVRRCVRMPDTEKFEVGFELMDSRWPDHLLFGTE